MQLAIELRSKFPTERKKNGARKKETYGPNYGQLPSQCLLIVNW